MDLSRYPRLNLFPRPTPLQELSRLQKAIGCRPRVFMKRDDLTGSGLGGNKNRKLDFVMAEVQASGADVVITWAGVQSNHCRQTLAVARHLGVDCHLVLNGEEPAVRQGNLLYYTILNANLHFVPESDAITETVETLFARLTRQGRKPYVVPMGASTPLGALGYVESMTEAIEQGASLGVTFGHAFVASGSAGTQAGVEVGAREACPPMRIHGVSVMSGAESQKTLVASVVDGTYKLLGIPKSLNPDEVIVHDQYYGGKYAVPTKAGNDAIRLVAETEGILLDPVYTGKAMSGMLDLLRKGKLDDSEAVLFFHTGGYPAIFAFADQFQK
jgi:D-cysteine desulfhydrase family pyridoxal phosphate-dependent enzyme